MADLLTRKVYRLVIKGLDHYRKQHEEDRKENPNSIPMGWKTQLEMMIDSKCREGGQRVQKGLAYRVLCHLADKGLLVRYAGDFTFPGEELPSEDDIKNAALIQMHKLSRSTNKS